MDTRKKKILQNTVEETEVLDDFNKIGYLIPVDKIHESEKLMESLIYNLVNKLDSMDSMNSVYNKKLIETKSYPDWIKYYVHIPCV